MSLSLYNLKKTLFAILLLALAIPYALNAQVTREQLLANEKFSSGINSFYEQQYNRAISEFQEALKLLPTTTLYREWLIRSYYYSGFFTSALDEIRYLQQFDSSNPILDKMQELLDYRNQIRLAQPSRDLWYSVLTIPVSEQGYRGKVLTPMGLATSQDGKNIIYASSLGNSSVFGFDINGNLKLEMLTLNKPFGIAMLNNKILVSDFAQNRINILNSFGIVTGNIMSADPLTAMNGPQYLTVDTFGNRNIYVSDFGNKRIAVFNANGDPSYSFDGKSPRFNGLSSPSGIAINNQQIYVADSLKQKIYAFDLYGNYAEEVISSGLNQPEEILFLTSNELLIADTSEVKLYNLTTKSLTQVYQSPLKNTKFSGMALDGNNRLWLSDYINNQIVNLAQLSTIQNGLWVSTLKVNTSRFPEVLLTLDVQDAMGNPFVGLQKSNFSIYDKGQYVNTEVEYHYNESNDFNLQIIYMATENSQKKAPMIRNYLVELENFFIDTDEVSLVEWGENNPYFIDKNNGNIDQIFRQQGFKSLTDKVNIGLNLRQSIDKMILSHKKKVIYFNYIDKLNPLDSFAPYGLIELANYMKANEVQFNLINLSGHEVDKEFAYLSHITGGTILDSNDVSRNSRLNPLMIKQRFKPSGRYMLKYKVQDENINTGVYRPLNVEVYVTGTSGRDDSGYVLQVTN